MKGARIVLTRRDLMKLGLMSFPVLDWGPSVALARTNAGKGGDAVTSPPTRPFVVELPIPPVAQPVQKLDVAPDPAAHQRFFEFPPRLFYEIHQKETKHSFHPDLPENLIWGFDGIFPGPTFHARYGEPIIVRFCNDLPANHVGFGIPETSTHLHNAHTASESDGFPTDFFFSGQCKDNHYPNIYAGGDPREALGTLWYHDHRVDFTTQNVYKGLVGFYLLFDELDSGHEEDWNPGLGLPSGDFDVPLAFADKAFTPDGQVFFDAFNFDGILGDKFTVNGVIQPFFKVARRKYRFRLLDAGPSRFYQFFLSKGQPGKTSELFTLIANDGNLLPAPLAIQSVQLGVANRMDVIIDFSNYKIGDQLFLENRWEQTNGRGPTGKILPMGDAILRFDVDRDAPDHSRVPSKLRELPPINLKEVATERSWVFARDQGAWVVNGKFFNVNEIRANPQQGTAEIWTLKNGGGGWSHPIHIHMEEFQILTRNGEPPAPHEVSRKDVVILGPGDEVRVFIRFRDWVGRYPTHCHNTVHEDHAMMFRWDLIDRNGDNRPSPRVFGTRTLP